MGVEDDGTPIGINMNMVKDMKKNFVNQLNNSDKMSPTLYLSIEDMEYEGMTLLWVYVCLLYTSVTGHSEEELINHLVFAGMAGMIDPPKKKVAQSVKTLKKAGVQVVMITGDYKDTAFAVARKIGIADSIEQCMTGRELEEISDAAFARRMKNIRVFARVTPAHKVRICLLYTSLGFLFPSLPSHTS